MRRPGRRSADDATAGWCPATTVETVGGATYSYRISAYKKGAELSVVSTGTAGEVSRRVDVGLISDRRQKHLRRRAPDRRRTTSHIKGNVNIETDLGTNGSIEKEGSSAVVCGNIRHGVGKTQRLGRRTATKKSWKAKRTCRRSIRRQTSPTNNSNCRLVPNCTGTGARAKSTPGRAQRKKQRNRTNTEPWDADTQDHQHRQRRDADAWAAATTTSAGSHQRRIDHARRVQSQDLHRHTDRMRNVGRRPADQHDVPAKHRSTGFGTANYNVPVIYLLGAAARWSLLGGSGTDHLVLYAPESEVEIGGGATWIGMIAGKSMNLHGNPTFKSDPNLVPPEITPHEPLAAHALRRVHRHRRARPRTPTADCRKPSAQAPGRCCRAR